MAKSKENDKHQPRSLTSGQRMFVDQLVTRFGENHTNVKRSDLKLATKEILSTSTAPSWITRNMNVRSKTKRGRYNLAALLKLPVEAFGDTPTKKKLSKKKVSPGVSAVEVDVCEVVPTPKAKKTKKTLKLVETPFDDRPFVETTTKKTKSIKAALAQVAVSVNAPVTLPEE